jgi:hypothetical protein
MLWKQDRLMHAHIAGRGDQQERRDCVEIVIRRPWLQRQLHSSDGHAGNFLRDNAEMVTRAVRPHDLTFDQD